MSKLWLKFGCFLTGHNYGILKNSSEASAKTVKKYLSAMLIVSILWAFVGFSFSQRYLKTDGWISTVVALILVIVIIQIERQIILTTGRNRLAGGFRIVIALVMAIIGSIIIDQILFKEDVEKARVASIQSEVNDILPSKTQELNHQIRNLDSMIWKKEVERETLIDEITKMPFIKGTTAERRNYQQKVRRSDGIMHDTLVTKTNYTFTDIPNPKAEFVPAIDEHIGKLIANRADKQNSLVNVRNDLEKELKEKTAFLDEIKLLVKILIADFEAIFVWLCLFFFFLAIELFVLVNKFGDKRNDYDRTVIHQMDVRLKMLEQLTKDSNSLQHSSVQ